MEKMLNLGMETLAQRLRDARKSAGLTQEELSKKAGVLQPHISKIERGTTLSSTAISRLAAALDVQALWLETGEGPRFLPGASNVTELKPRARVPLISWVQAGEMSDVVDLFHPGEAVRWEDAVASAPTRSAYALLVEGDSMVSPSGGVSFPPGTVLIVDPGRSSSAGDFVIAKDISTQKATFKQLTTDGSRWYLKPLNNQYPVVEIDDPALRVIARVIEAKPPSIKL